MAALLAAFVPLSELAELVNIGTLFAFLLVNLGVIVLRRTKPDLERPFRVPLVPVVPAHRRRAVHLPHDPAWSGATWWRFGIWLVIGLVIYFAYSRTPLHAAARAAAPTPAPTEPELLRGSRARSASRASRTRST